METAGGAHLHQLADNMPIEVLFDGEWYSATVKFIGAEAVSVYYIDAQEDEDIPVSNIGLRIRLMEADPMSEADAALMVGAHFRGNRGRRRARNLRRTHRQEVRVLRQQDKQAQNQITEMAAGQMVAARFRGRTLDKYVEGLQKSQKEEAQVLAQQQAKEMEQARGQLLHEIDALKAGVKAAHKVHTKRKKKAARILSEVEHFQHELRTCKYGRRLKQEALHREQANLEKAKASVKVAKTKWDAKAAAVKPEVAALRKNYKKKVLKPLETRHSQQTETMRNEHCADMIEAKTITQAYFSQAQNAADVLKKANQLLKQHQHEEAEALLTTQVAEVKAAARLLSRSRVNLGRKRVAALQQKHADEVAGLEAGQATAAEAEEQKNLSEDSEAREIAAKLEQQHTEDLAVLETTHVERAVARRRPVKQTGPPPC